MQNFIKKQDVLNIALNKVKARLLYYSKNTVGNCDFSDWNQWHDLEYRIGQRLKQNYLSYLEWHFNTYQFVAISL